MGKQLDLKNEFRNYLYELENYCYRVERFYDDLEHNRTHERMTQWLEAAFICGARAVANDTVETLLDYGTAVAGVDGDKKVYNRTEAFDAAANNLVAYYSDIFDEVDK